MIHRNAFPPPDDWINEDNVSMNFQFLRYAQPLIQGEVALPYDNGLPVYGIGE